LTAGILHYIIWTCLYTYPRFDPVKRYRSGLLTKKSLLFLPSHLSSSSEYGVTFLFRYFLNSPTFTIGAFNTSPLFSKYIIHLL
jgi:hypothetical protein